GGNLVVVDGLGDRDVPRGQPRWHSFSSLSSSSASAFVIDWKSRGGALGELELWALDVPPRGPSTDAADELYAGLPERAALLRATPAEAPVVAAGAEGADVALALASDPRAYERAFLVYELEGLPHWTFVPRQINGRPTAHVRAGFDNAGAGGLQVEEITPAWL